MRWKIILVFSVCILQTLAIDDNSTIFRFCLDTTEQLKLTADFIEETGIDVFHSLSTSRPNFAYLKMQDAKKLAAFLRSLNAEYKLIDDKKLIEMERAANAKAKSRVLSKESTSCWASIAGYFARFGEITAWMEKIAKCESFISVLSIGKSYEGRDMKVLKISVRKDLKLAMVVTAGMHAREWLAVASLIYMIEKLLERYKDGDKTARRLLESYDVYFVPVFNPDGYEYTFRKTRLWRKSRSPQKNRTIGVDLNRNFDIDFGGKGASKKAISSTYHGPYAFSEPEVANFRDFILSFDRRLKLYVDLHTFGLLWLLPSRFRKKRPLGEAELRRVAQIGAAAIYKVNGSEFTVGTSKEILYLVSGSSYDWMHYVAKVKYAFTLELRTENNVTGFVSPPATIPVSGEELYEGLTTITKEIEDHEVGGGGLF